MIWAGALAAVLLIAVAAARWRGGRVCVTCASPVSHPLLATCAAVLASTLTLNQSTYSTCGPIGGSTSSDGMRAVIPYVRTYMYAPVPCWLPVGDRRANSGGRAAWRVERARPCGT
eukprot:COSAG01_NODE_2141_length_8319_cov_4.012406_7_plen_116_part_00